MKKSALSRIPENVRKVLEDVREVSDQKGVAAWLVGGMVRDLILKRFSIDVDLVVEGPGVLFARTLAARWGARCVAHQRFGTAVLQLPDGLRVDVVTARRETYARPGALPDVIFGQISDDLFRRDFTINAIACSLASEDFGLIRDDFDGVSDLKKRILRVMHYRSFVDDPTRILRAVRYEKRFDLKMEDRTLAALKSACHEDAFRTITPVRYFHEFVRILEEEDPLPALRRLRSVEGLRYFSLDAHAEKMIAKIVMFQKEKGIAIRSNAWILRISALLACLPQDRIDHLLKIFQVARADRREIDKFLHFLSVPDMLPRLQGLFGEAS
ncbi:MAG: CCA tRNA nucleotidyltransferase [Elusimicrobia bacterium]|nr:CCA tRNA nucleotidyltransferase [Elusimicrobiota bacterium]